MLGAPVDRIAWARTRPTVHFYRETSPGSNPDTSGLETPLVNLFFSPLKDEAGGGGREGTVIVVMNGSFLQCSFVFQTFNR